MLNTISEEKRIQIAELFTTRRSMRCFGDQMTEEMVEHWRGSFIGGQVFDQKIWLEAPRDQSEQDIIEGYACEIGLWPYVWKPTGDWGIHGIEEYTKIFATRCARYLIVDPEAMNYMKRYAWGRRPESLAGLGLLDSDNNKREMSWDEDINYIANHSAHERETIVSCESSVDFIHPEFDRPPHAFLERFDRVDLAIYNMAEIADAAREEQEFNDLPNLSEDLANLSSAEEEIDYAPSVYESIPELPSIDENEQDTGRTWLRKRSCPEGGFEDLLDETN